MIFIESESGQTFPGDLLERAARAVLDLSGTQDADLTIVLVDDARIQALNRDFLAHDAPTDVLSFPADEPDPETGRRYLGDVVISTPRAGEQARERGHAVEAEMQLLVVHGILHLLGHDHAEVGEKERMWAAQARALERLGVSAQIVHE
ncbi:MAG: rRNA maturation RNase YbeY [Anaerolineales bacterium]|jgi:probable rRNA maturation factor